MQHRKEQTTPLPIGLLYVSCKSCESEVFRLKGFCFDSWQAITIDLQVGPAPRTFMNLLRRYFSALWLLLLVTACAAIVVLEQFGGSTEVLQTIFAPVVILCFWKIPNRKSLQLPAVMVAAAILCWFISALQLKGYLLAGSFPAGPYLSRLDNDRYGLKTREFYDEFNRIARTYSLNSLRLIYRHFDEDAGARQWISRNASSRLVLRRNPYWMRAVLPDQIAGFSPSGSAVGAAGDDSLAEEFLCPAELREGGVPILVPGTSIRLWAAPSFEYFELPNSPLSLSSHLLSWLSDGLWPLMREDPNWNSMDSALKNAIRRDRFYEATTMLGPWKSPEPLAASHFFLGTLDLFESAGNRGAQKDLRKCSLAQFSRAAAYVKVAKHPFLGAAVFNNSAVLAMLQRPDYLDLERVREWLWFAASAAEYSPNPPRGARLAFCNIMTLEKAGIL